jgi:hypothetical protein
MTRIFSIFFLVTLFVGQIKGQSLRNDTIAIETLDKFDLGAFSGLLGFAETMISCQQNENRSSCWVDFLKSEAFDNSSANIEIPWDIKSQNGFIGKLNLKQVTDSIWIKSWSYDYKTKDTSDYYLINLKSSFAKLLVQSSKTNRDWEQVWQSIEAAGEIGPSLHSVMFNSEYNNLLSDPKMRLLMTIQLMTILKNEREI